MKSTSNGTNRFRVLFILMCGIGVYILSCALRTMLPPEREYWLEVSKQFTRKNIELPANRGNLLACDGQLLAGSVPEYRLYLDYVVIDKDSASREKAQAWRDTAFIEGLDSIVHGLARIFPDRSEKWFRERLLRGKKLGSHAWRIYPRHASYIQLQECRKLPLLRESSLKGGFYYEPIIQRKKPFGGLASRTLGDLVRDSSSSAKCGLELSFDSILRGTPGIGHRTKVRDRRVSFVDVEPKDGHDLLTTIDVNIQDVADKALRKKLKEPSVNGEVGIAIVMEVSTGDVKAIVNLTRGSDGEYYEVKNNAVSDLMEPGSTFKTASIMVGLEDGLIKKTDRVDCTGGIYQMHGRYMKDHNWRKGGYGSLTVSEILEQSSNIGVSRLIDQAYHDNPQRYVDGLRREGVGIPLNLPFVGKGEPKVPRPGDPKRYWSKTDLPWMSIGYVTMLPPISTLTFYNAIANGGRMVKPRFVTAELSGGEVVRTFPTEVIKESICSKHTLDDIQEILEKVVSKGLGRKAGNGGKYFKVSGKTGTAQIASSGGRGYHSGVTRYMVSFCGYYPSESPKYSTLVCIVKTGLPASGGGQCGPVFSEISQYVMSKGIYRAPKDAADSTSVFVPAMGCGDSDEARMLASHMGLTPDSVGLLQHPDSIKEGQIPNVMGMGARTAIYTLRAQGLKVNVKGTGRVVSQSKEPGSPVRRGETIVLTLGWPHDK